MPRPRPFRVRRATMRGFTIVEMLVTLTLVVLLGAAISRLFVGQLRSYGRLQAANDAQRDLRLGLSLLPMDLRAASVQLLDIRAMTDTSITLRATIGSSVACGRPTNRIVDLPAQGLTKNVLTSWYAQPGRGDWATIYVSNDADPTKDSWRLLTIDSVTAAPNNACPGDPFTPAADAAKQRWRVYLTDTVSTTDAGVGKPLRFLRKASYSLYKPASSTRWYLGYRDSVAGVWSNVEPIAGPFASANGSKSGVYFTYFDTTGAAIPTPIAAPLRVGRVDVTLRTLSRVRGERDTLLVRDSMRLRIALRNRQTQ